MKTKHKRIFTCVIIFTLILGAIVGINFSKTAIAVTGSDSSHAEYGERLKDQTPASLEDASWSWYTGDKSEWVWVDDENSYFGNAGQQTLVARNATATAFDAVTLNVHRRGITPVAKVNGAGTLANFVSTGLANITDDAYSRTVSVTAGEGGTVSGAGSYPLGSPATITATANEGYSFVKWSDDDTTNPRNITVNDNITYTAEFEAATDTTLPRLGQVAFMKLSDLFTCLEGFGSTVVFGSESYYYDPTYGYDTSTYYVYAINDIKGTNDALSNSTSDNLRTVGNAWYSQLNKPTTNNNYWDNAGLGTHSLFGGPLYWVYRNSEDVYSFGWYYSTTEAYHTDWGRYWDANISGDVVVAVVKANNTMAVTSSLPVDPGDVSIMTLEQAFTALANSNNSGNDTYFHYDPSDGYNTSTYYMYAINDTAGTDDATSVSTVANLQAVGIDWYKQLNKPITYDNYWVNAGNGSHNLFGGPLCGINRTSDGRCSLGWYCLEFGDTCSENDYWNCCVDGSAYVTVVKSGPIVRASLPINQGDVSIMTLEQAFIALGGSVSETGYGRGYDPTYGYDSSTYYMYGIVGDGGSNSTSDSLQAVEVSWYQQLNKPTTKDTHWTVGNYQVCGGPLYDVDYDNSKYYFDWYCPSGFDWFEVWGSGLNVHWGSSVSGSVYVAIVKANNSMVVTSSLPTEPGDVSIMTIEEAFTALGDSNGYGNDPTEGYDSSTYYIYAINDNIGTNDSTSVSTSSNLKAIGIDWYKQLNKPITFGSHWIIGDHKVFGGPLEYVCRESDDAYSFGWFYKSYETSYSNFERYWCADASGSTYVAVVKSGSMLVRSSLPTRVGDVSIMTLEQAFTVLANSNSFNNNICHYDPSCEYDTSQYYVYGITGSSGSNSTAANLQAVGLNWYKQLNKPTTLSQTFTSSGKTIFGGPLYAVAYDCSLGYAFKWCYGTSIVDGSSGSSYWDTYVTSSVCVAIVKANNTVTVTSSLPAIQGDVSIMTLEQMYAALGGSTSSSGYQSDSYSGYNTSTYYVYAINDASGTNDAVSVSTSENLRTIPIDWYKQLNKPTTLGNRWANAGDSSHAVFGGPLDRICYDSKGTYYFRWYYSSSGTSLSSLTNYWTTYVPGSVCVAVVRVK